MVYQTSVNADRLRAAGTEFDKTAATLQDYIDRFASNAGITSAYGTLDVGQAVTSQHNATASQLLDYLTLMHDYLAVHAGRLIDAADRYRGAEDEAAGMANELPAGTSLSPQ